MLPAVQVIGLSQTAAAKLCADKIRVNCVAPTAVATVRLILLPLTPSCSTDSYARLQEEPTRCGHMHVHTLAADDSQLSATR